MDKLEENERLKNENEQLPKPVTETKLLLKAPSSVDKIKHSDSLMTLYTGLDSYNLFEWIYNQVKEKVPILQWLHHSDLEILTKQGDISGGREIENCRLAVRSNAQSF